MDKQQILSQIEAVKEKRNELTNERDTLQNEYDNFEVEVSDDEYNDWLDSIYPAVSIGSIEFSPSEVLENLDPTAHRCGKIDYVDSLDKDDQDECIELLNSIENLDCEIDDLSDELENLEDELLELGE